MKQSSIEWIYNNLKSHFEHDGDLLEAVKMSFEQAKAMHKEEIENAVKQGWDYNEEGLVQWMGEKYYNETFNTNQENLQDSTNGYTYYPQEYKTVFNTKEKWTIAFFATTQNTPNHEAIIQSHNRTQRRTNVNRNPYDVVWRDRLRRRYTSGNARRWVYNGRYIDDRERRRRAENGL